MVELTINDRKIQVEEGTTILKAAQANGIKIPNLCFDKRLRPYGGCRLCVVEVEGQPRLFASCSTPVGQGMVVRTETPKLRKARQTVLELLLIHHPLDCPICDKAGECDLQDLAYEYGKPVGRFIRHRKSMPPDVRGPLVELTANRCILCGKCVRICSEHQGRGALGFIGRGFPTVVQPAFGEVLECDYCGQCIDICPTGALLSKPFKFQARAWFLEEKDTTCPFCGCGCTLTVGTREGRILRSRAKEDSGRSDGNLCGRGRFGFDFLYSENRLKTPMIRRDDVLEPATWEEALAYVGDTLKAITTVHGRGSVGAIGSHRCTNEDNLMLKKFMQNVIGSPNLDSSAAFGYSRVLKSFGQAFGDTTHPISMEAPLGKEAILVVESDLSVTHPVFGLNILRAKREGARLIVADSRETKLTRHSTSRLQMRPGTSVALINGLMKVIIDKGLFDRQTASAMKGFGELEAGLSEYTPEKVSGMTGLTAEEITSAAEEFAKAKSRMVALTISGSDNAKGSDTVLAAANLVTLLGEPAEALQIPAEYANTFGLYRAGITPAAGEPGGKGLHDMLYESGSLRAMYIMGEDPVSAFPRHTAVVRSLKALEFLVVQDIALTETAKLAHVVLPAAGWAEKDGTFTNAEGVTQEVRKMVDAPGQALPDWKILRNLCLSMGSEVAVRKREDLSAEVAAVTRPDEARQRCFVPVSHSKAAATDRDHPFELVTRDILQHSGTMSTRSKALDLVVSEPFLEMNCEDARERGIMDNSHVKIISRRGSIFLKAKVTEEVPRGAVFTSVHFPHGRVNALTSHSANGAPTIEAVRIETAAP